MQEDKAEVELTADERDLIDQILDMYAENPTAREKYRASMYLVASELKNGRSPVQEGE